MYDVAVCIPTHQRPEMLKKTILSISQSNLTGSNIRKIDIIVVDNDAAGSAEKAVGELVDDIPEIYQLKYSIFPQKGLTNVRNELLRKALQLNPTHVVFIDDDEYASKDWLKELLGTLKRTNSDMAMGRIISVFNHEVPT